MSKYKTKKDRRNRRHLRLRQKVSGTATCPRMSVFVSSKHMYVQFIDDVNGHTLAASSTLDASFEGQSNVDGAAILGKIAGEKAKAAGIETAVFDRGGFRYHGRVKAIADGAREAGLNI